jgi:hypothetical protein
MNKCISINQAKAVGNLQFLLNKLKIGLRAVPAYMAPKDGTYHVSRTYVSGDSHAQTAEVVKLKAGETLVDTKAQAIRVYEL